MELVELCMKIRHNFEIIKHHNVAFISLNGQNTTYSLWNCTTSNKNGEQLDYGCQRNYDYFAKEVSGRR